MKNVKYTKDKIVWVNLIFFSLTTLVAVIGGPIYLYHYGISLSEVLLTLAFMALTGLGITMGYHRLFSHITYKTNIFWQFIALFFGGAAFEQSALRWSSQHRDHHLHVDTDKDPYNVKEGFWHAHMLWMIFDSHVPNYDNAKDLQKSPLIVHQDKHYFVWAAVAGILLPLALGALMGHLLGAFIFSVCFRIFFVHQATFCINSVCHWFGKPTYDIYASAKDHWFVALLSYGEGYHNFHHRFPADYRNGIRWYHWDPSKWFIALFSRLGWAWNVKKVPEFRILEARLAAEKQRVSDCLKEHVSNPRVDQALQAFQLQYEKLLHSFTEWEKRAKEYQKVLQTEFAHHSEGAQKITFEQVQIAKKRFEELRESWRELLSIKPLDLPNLLIAPV